MVPLVYFHRTVPGRYLSTCPVFIIGDDPNLPVFSSVAVNSLYHGGTKNGCCDYGRCSWPDQRRL